MSLRNRFSYLALAIVLCAGVRAAALVPRTAAETFTPFAPPAPPQRAYGDFDGDGRVDTALIQADPGDRISVRLSQSFDTIQLEAAVVGVIEGDVDHDGDLDLVAATASGDVLIWLNDGHGRFTRLPESTLPGLSGDPAIVQTTWPEAAALGVRAFVASPTDRAERIIIAAALFPPTPPVILDGHSAILPPLRAPPAPSV
jgi:hypothetical protein